MEYTKNHLEFLEEYGAIPFQVDGETESRLRQEFIDGYKEGRKNKDGKDEEVLILEGKRYTGFNVYPNHKGSSNKVEARKNQRNYTTSIKGRELKELKNDSETIYKIVFDVKKLTGLSVCKIDILRKSETGKEGKKEANFLIT